MANPDEILASTTEQVRDLIEKILKVEKDYEYIQNIELNQMLEKEIGEKLTSIFEKEISKWNCCR